MIPEGWNEGSQWQVALPESVNDMPGMGMNCQS